MTEVGVWFHLIKSFLQTKMIAIILSGMEIGIRIFPSANVLEKIPNYPLSILVSIPSTHFL